MLGKNCKFLTASQMKNIVIKMFCTLMNLDNYVSIDDCQKLPLPYGLRSRSVKMIGYLVGVV